MIFLLLQSQIYYPNILLLIAAILVTRFHNHFSFVIVCTTYAVRLRTDGMMAKLEKFLQLSLMSRGVFVAIYGSIAYF